MGKWLLVLGLLGIALFRGESVPARKPAPPPRPPPPPKEDERKLARGLFSNDPAQMESLANKYDAIGLKETARELRRHAAELRAKPPAAAPSPPPAPIVPPVPAPPPAAEAPGTHNAVPMHDIEPCRPPMQGPDLVMVPECHYRARLDLSGIQCLGGESDIAGEFEKRGFHDVRIYMRISALPADWPAAERQTVSGFTHCTRWAEGTWGGALKQMARPDFVASMWLAV